MTYKEGRQNDTRRELHTVRRILASNFQESSLASEQRAPDKASCSTLFQIEEPTNGIAVGMMSKKIKSSSIITKSMVSITLAAAAGLIYHVMKGKRISFCDLYWDFFSKKRNFFFSNAVSLTFEVPSFKRYIRFYKVCFKESTRRKKSPPSLIKIQTLANRGPKSVRGGESISQGHQKPPKGGVGFAWKNSSVSPPVITLTSKCHNFFSILEVTIEFRNVC